jgi:hypothetical protein
MKNKSLVPEATYVLHIAYEEQISCSRGDICPSSRL